MTDRIWIWFADNGNIRKWSTEPFDEGTEYRALASLPSTRVKVRELPEKPPLAMRMAYDELNNAYRVDRFVNFNLVWAKILPHLDALSCITPSVDPAGTGVVEALRKGWEYGRMSWCPAGILADTERTERDWAKARSDLTAAIGAGGRDVAADIGDAVLDWMVKYDLLDAGNEYHVADVLAVLNDLTPTETSALGAGGQAVAWRYRGHFHDKPLPWQYTDAKWLVDRQAEYGEEIEPLYTHPSPSLPLRDEVERVLEPFADKHVLEAYEDRSPVDCAFTAGELRAASALLSRLRAGAQERQHFGPYGYLIKPNGLNEEHWRLSDEPSAYPDEEVSVPLYAIEDQFPAAPSPAKEGGR